MDIQIRAIEDEKNNKEDTNKSTLKDKLKVLMDNDELWNICTFIMVFIVMLVLSYLNVYGVTDSVVYSFSFASLLLSTSQVINTNWNKILYMSGHIVLILGGGINVEIIENIKSVLSENTLLILSLIVIFIGFLFNKINIIKSENKKEQTKEEINSYLRYLDIKYKEDKDNVLNFVDEMKYLIEASDINMTDKVQKGKEYYEYIKNNDEYIKSIEFIKFKVNNALEEAEK